MKKSAANRALQKSPRCSASATCSSSLSLDEGSAITDGIIPGVAAPVAMIGIGEKGYLTLKLTVSSPGGHSSLPPSESAIGILSRAIDKVERTRFPGRINDAVKEFFNFVGPELSWDKKILLANLWLTEPWLKRELAKSPLTDSMIRTTQATTIFHAGDKENVLPAQAQAVINFRLISGDTIEAVTARIRQVIGDARVKITPLPNPMDPSPISSIDADSFKLVHRTIQPGRAPNHCRALFDDRGNGHPPLCQAHETYLPVRADRFSPRGCQADSRR